MQNRHSLRSRHRFGKDIRKAGQEVDVMLIEYARRWAIDLENAPWLTLASDQNIDRRDNPVLRIERRKNETVVLRNIFNDYRFARDERPTLRRALIGARNDAPDD